MPTKKKAVEYATGKPVKYRNGKVVIPYGYEEAVEGTPQTLYAFREESRVLVDTWEAVGMRLITDPMCMYINPIPQTSQKFWVVWRQGANIPFVKHETKESAQQEAERIAHKHPGSKVYVLEAVSVTQTSGIKTKELK